MSSTDVNKAGICPCCQRHCRLTLHHLIPRKVHRRRRFQRHMTKEQRQQGIMICRQCHNGIHRFYDEMTLAVQLNSLSSLCQDPKLARYFQWVSKQRIRL